MTYIVVASPVDLDSVASIYLIRKVLGDKIREIKFLQHSEIENIEADYLVDTPHGKARIYRFDHHNTKEATCSAMKVVEYFKLGEAELRFAKAVCWQDNAGWRVLTREGMDNLLDTVIKSMECAGKTPMEILDFSSKIFDNLLIKFEKDIQLKNKIKESIKYKSEKLLVIEGDFPKDLIFSEFDPSFLLKYHDFSFSITRNAKVIYPSLYEFKDFLRERGINTDGWFFHPQGFFVGFQGSENNKPGLEIEKLINLVEEYISHQNF